MLTCGCSRLTRAGGGEEEEEGRNPGASVPLSFSPFSSQRENKLNESQRELAKKNFAAKREQGKREKLDLRGFGSRCRIQVASPSFFSRKIQVWRI